MDPGRLAGTVTHPDGSKTRWGYDEVDSGTIPSDLTFGTSAPGGMKDLSCSLLRGLTPRPDEALFSNVRFYGPGNQTAWDGRVAQLPRQTGPGSLSPGAVGWGQHLQDFEGFMEVYVDRDPSRWQDAALARRVALSLAGIALGNIPSATTGGISFSPTEGQTLYNTNYSELVYSAPPGCKIHQFQYVGGQAASWTGFEDPTLWMGTDPQFSTYYQAPLTFDLTKRAAFPTAARYAMVRAAASATITPIAGMLRTIGPLAVYGNHGLTLHATVTGEPDGVYASDVVADVVARAAPMLNFTTGSGGTIRPTTFTVPHLVIDTPTTAADAISRVNAYHAWDWLVWEDRTFYFQPPGDGVEWQARIGDGASLSLEGDAADQIINGVIVAYTADGITKYAGPVGSGMDVESGALRDADVENPASAAGIARKWPTLHISVPTTDAGAVELGAIYLTERNLATRLGQMVLTGMVRHPTEGMLPAWRVRAGDTVKLTDRPGDPPRRIIETSYSHPRRQITLTLDSTAHKLDALIERLAVSTGLLT